MAHHEAGAAHTAHRTADDEYLPVPGASYEHTDANVWMIVKFGLWLAVTALIVHVGIGLMYSMLIEQSKDTAPQRYPLAASREAQLPREPRLQESPQAEIEDLKRFERQRLGSYGWVNKETGEVHIPIEDAMRLTLERGLAARPEDPEHGNAPASVFAQDSSAGRTTARRRQ